MSAWGLRLTMKPSVWIWPPLQGPAVVARMPHEFSAMVFVTEVMTVWRH